MKELVEELKVVTDWFNFGTHLGVRQAKLLAIGKNYDREGPERCKTETLIVWMDQEQPTWSKIIQALVKIGMGALAQKIAAAHGEWSVLTMSVEICTECYILSFRIAYPRCVQGEPAR